jgi:hypothetical protein
MLDYLLGRVAEHRQCCERTSTSLQELLRELKDDTVLLKEEEEQVQMTMDKSDKYQHHLY